MAPRERVLKRLLKGKVTTERTEDTEFLFVYSTTLLIPFASKTELKLMRRPTFRPVILR